MAITSFCRRENQLILYKVFFVSTRATSFVHLYIRIVTAFYTLPRLVCKIFTSRNIYVYIYIYKHICTLVYMLYNTICCLHLFSYLDRMIGILYIINSVQHLCNYLYLCADCIFYYNLCI